jgi:hypothetical protein
MKSRQEKNKDVVMLEIAENLKKRFWGRSERNFWAVVVQPIDAGVAIRLQNYN